MNYVRLLAGVVLLAGCSQRTDTKQACTDASSAAIAELWKLHPPPKPWREHEALRAWTKPPADDSPIDILVDYWSAERKREPSSKVRARFLAEAERNFSIVPEVIEWLPHSDAACRVMEQWYASASKEPGFRTEAWAWVPQAVRNRSSTKRADLVRAVRNPATADDGAEALEALARVDWAAAEPLAVEYLDAKDPVLKLAGLEALYERAVGSESEPLRAALRELVETSTVRGRVRESAFDVVWSRPWPGRDDWYLSLFRDPTLVDLMDDFYVFHPLARPLWSNPDHWIPVVARLVGNSDRAVHDNAVTCLAQFEGENARADAMLPLLPWLSDPDWARAGDRWMPSYRQKLIWSLHRAHLPEAVPGLIAAAQFRQDGWRAAAEALGNYKCEASVKALWQLHRQGEAPETVFAALVRVGAVPTEDVVARIESQALEGSCGPQLEVGEALAMALIARAQEIAAAEPEIAERLLALVWERPLDVVNTECVRQIVEGDPSVACLLAAIRRREALARNAELRDLARKGTGTARGIAAALVGDTSALEGTDRAAQRALLACSRWGRIAVPVESVARLLETEVSSQAELYLASDDRPESHRAVLARHKGEARVIGWHSGHIPELEEQLRATLLEKDGPREIFALSESTEHGCTEIVVAVHEDRVEISNNVRAWRERKKGVARLVPENEWRLFRDFVSTNRIDSIPSTGFRVYDGVKYWYWHMTGGGGHRLFIDSPPNDWPHDALYYMIVRRFQRLARLHRAN